MPYVIVRPGNAYGPGQRPYTGQGLVATAIASLMQHKELTMFGGEEIVRDYVHVEDLAKAITAVLEHGQIAATYNIGTAVGTSNKTVVDLVEAEAKRQNLDPVIKRQPARPFDVPTNVLDSGKLTDDTGWKPTKSFEEGVKETWAWLQTNLS
jgi:UDP-glucose 4-epimerase